MPNKREFLTDRFLVVSGSGGVQSAIGTPMANGDLDTRHKCVISREEIVQRREYRDCRDEDMTKAKIDSRMARYVFDYQEVNPQIIAQWSFLYLGAVAAPTGTPANEVQTFTRSGTVSGGTFTISLTLEGRTVVTKPIAYDASNGVIQAAVTHARMLFIQPGDVVVSGNWGAGVALTFPDTGNLGRANIPALVIDNTNITGGGNIVVTQTTAGDQNYHDGARSTSRVKHRFSFALGWETDEDRVEKYADFAVEAVTANTSLDGNVTFQVSVVGPWEYDSIETTFPIPECTNIDALMARDCRFTVNNAWQTVDLNTFSAVNNDNVPTDRLSAFSFDGMDIQNINRGRQPSYGWNASLFGSEVDPVYELAQNERTAAEVPASMHFGYPGNRCTWNFPKSEIRFQTNRQSSAGEAQISTFQIDGVPMKNGANPPFDVEAWLPQSTAFLST